MSRRQFINKRTAKTFTLVHRPQHDPLIHDDTAPEVLFAPKLGPQQSPTSSSTKDTGLSGDQDRFRSRQNLDEEFGRLIRPNEGEAAEYGVFFDDTEYDYMQHLRDLGSDGEGGEVTWVEAPSGRPGTQDKGRGKRRLEDALRDLNIQGETGSASSESVVGSSVSLLTDDSRSRDAMDRRRTYEAQQDVPDEIAGFDPDMDPRLREVLEALDDDAYVDGGGEANEEGDIFSQLIRDAEELEREEWERLGEQQMFEEGEVELDDNGWESDNTIRAASPSSPQKVDISENAGGDAPAPPDDAQAPPPPSDPATSGAWLTEFHKFKSDNKSLQSPVPMANRPQPAPPSSIDDSSALSSLARSRRKKRKGARTSTTNYSMTSSSLTRTDQQTLLDARFDRLEAAYAAEEDDELASESRELNDTASLASAMSATSAVSKYSAVSGLSGVSGLSSYSRASDSEAPQLERADFGSIVDEFLDGHNKTGKSRQRIRRGRAQAGMEQLDEIRQGLGPARVKRTAANSAAAA